MNTPHTCPGCGRDDFVQAVPAVYVAGRDAVTSRERNQNGHMRTVTRTVTTGLADALAPVPPKPTYALGCLGLLAAAVSVGAFLGGVFAGDWFRDEPVAYGWYEVTGEMPGLSTDYGFLGWISAVALAVAVLVFAVVYRRRAAFARLIRDRARAEELWSHGWYCHRCGTVHFVGVPGEVRAPLTLQRFREKVWERGGYGALAAERRAVDPARDLDTYR
ncbi:hypothetical protein [Streptomyces sp. CC208A]|uniref:hypothetical protein n=1 Tax=Streptomyces sp. CC208A TaxID=3044573 RepID=UPI0024A9661F|nr:hypothetical protein [Streptomyces sp. CC208A]